MVRACRDGKIETIESFSALSEVPGSACAQGGLDFDEKLVMIVVGILNRRKYCIHAVRIGVKDSHLRRRSREKIPHTLPACTGRRVSIGCGIDHPDCAGLVVPPVDAVFHIA